MTTQYAPVLIPTLCRYKHFFECIESLKNNSLSQDTTLYIALDYPLKKEHEDGYKKILSYLPLITGFKKVIIIRRDTNYGTTKNIKEAKKIILQNYDCFVLSEDDNVFSPNFLEYMNKGLEKFKDEKTVLAISGYRHFYNLKFKNNNFFRQNVDFSSWGYGIWKDRYDEYQNKCTRKYFRYAICNPVKYIRVWKNGTNMLQRLRNYSRGEWDGVVIDSVLSVYMAIEKKVVIMPAISKVRNMGWDKSGIHSLPDDPALVQKHLSQTIDTALSFDFKGTGKEYFRENHKTYVNESYGHISFIYLLIRYIYKKIFRRTN
jgi:hypothetical protein